MSATVLTKQPAAKKPQGAGLFVWVAEHTVLVALGILFAAPVLFVLLTSLMSGSQTLTAALWPNPRLPKCTPTHSVPVSSAKTST